LAAAYELQYFHWFLLYKFIDKLSMRCKIKIKLKAACGSRGTAKDGEYQALGH
jgi:hypothetical protein